ncbi:DUF3299 domain-containing protein [Variovorax sp. RT4R15]|uniref:DUF3299 domain-containing protein n=1 Tax=Variovorax sp. RT4R15 TaxID=3443737 RepID=UPI003F47A620
MNLLRTPSCLLATAALLALAGCDPLVKPKAAAGVANAPAPVVVAAAAPAARDIPWEELIPKSWDPTKRFRGLNLDNLKDNDPRAKQMLEDLRATWDNAPVNTALDGEAVRLPGFVVPLESVDGAITDFLLVPYFGACIHTPPPPANQIIRVLAATPQKGLRAMDTVWVSGTLEAARFNSGEMGVSGYRLKQARVEPYTEKPPQS